MESQPKKRGSLTTVACKAASMPMTMSKLTNPDCPGDRCRGRKTKCDGVRPECRSCVERGEDCNYAAEPDASPTVALRRQLHALQQRTSDQEELVRLLTTVAEPDAQQLLVRLRIGENVTSLVSAGREMQTIGDSSEATSSCSSRQRNEETPQDSDERHVEVTGTVSPSLSLRPAAVRVTATSLMVLEPTVDDAKRTNATNSKVCKISIWWLAMLLVSSLLALQFSSSSTWRQLIGISRYRD